MQKDFCNSIGQKRKWQHKFVISAPLPKATIASAFMSTRRSLMPGRPPQSDDF
jgi:hypothetical protein